MSKISFGRSRKQTVLALLGVVVALGASFGIYSQYAATHAATTYIGYNNDYGEGVFAYACQNPVPGGYKVTVRYDFSHAKAYNHTYWGGIFNYTGGTQAWTSSGTSVAGFQSLYLSHTYPSNQNNYLGFFVTYGSSPYATANNVLIGWTTQWRPSGLLHC